MAVSFLVIRPTVGSVVIEEAPSYKVSRAETTSPGRVSEEGAPRVLSADGSLASESSVSPEHATAPVSVIPISPVMFSVVFAAV